MPTFRILAMFVAATIATAAGPVPLKAQSAPAANPSNSISIHISLPKKSYAIGEKPILAMMAIKNVSSNKICFSTDPYLSRIHVTSKDGEPPKTELLRHRLGEFRPGDGPDLLPGPIDCRPIAPGALDSRGYNLALFYDLSTPGDYSVYLEIYDPAGPKDGSGHWLRTNTAKFEIQAPAQ